MGEYRNAPGLYMGFMALTFFLYSLCFSVMVSDTSSRHMMSRVRCASYVVLELFLIYLFSHGCIWCVSQAMGCNRFRRDDELYTDPVDDSSLRFGRPRLTMSSIWSLVYGLGFVFYVLSYVLGSIGGDVFCAHSYAWGMCGVIVCDVGSEPRTEKSLKMLGILVLGLVADIMAFLSSDLYAGGLYPDSYLELFTIITSFVLPVIANIVMIGVKEGNTYYIHDMLELCHFGLPFMFIMALGYVCVSDTPDMVLAQEQAFIQNVTVPMTSDEAIFQTKHVAAILFAPWLLLLSLYLAGSRMMKGQSVDVLLSIVFVVLVRDSGGSISWTRGGAWAALCAGACARLWREKKAPKAMPGPPVLPSDDLDLESPPQVA